MITTEERPPIPSFNLYERCVDENGDAFRRPLIFTYIGAQYNMSEYNGKNIRLATQKIHIYLLVA